MAVYVDDAFVAGDWGRWTGGGHLQADTPEELAAFAARLGLASAWLQTRPGRPERAHYDLTAAGRRRALDHGAVAETWRDGVRRRRAARELEAPVAVDRSP
jgi:Ser/Thr protein kinase RdoA (MazF antagonist)